MEISIKNMTVTRDTEGFSSVTIPPSEAARIYLEYPEVQAEVDRQRKEKEIKVGDWYWAYRRPRKCTRIDGNHIWDKSFAALQDHCTKIPGPPEFIAFLEQGVKR